MFRKGALPIAVLSAICSALFCWWINNAFKEMIGVAIIIFLIYFTCFLVTFGAIYDISHKIKIKYNKYLLGCGICGVVLFTAFFKGFEYSSIFLGFVCVASLITLIILGNIAIQYEKKKE